MRHSIYRLGRFSLKYLYVGGAGLLAMGLVMGFVSDSWWPVPLLAILLGSSLIVGWGYSWLHRTGWPRSGQRRMLLQSWAVIVSLIVINSLIVLNSGRIDLTENQLFTLSSQTQQLVKSLPKPLKVWIFSQHPTAGMAELLVNYQKLNPRFSYEFANIQSAVAQQFNVQAPGEVYLEFGTKKSLLRSLNPGEFLTETALTTGIEQITRDRQEQIYFLQGHGEPELPGTAIKALQAKNYLVKPLILAQTQIPTTTNVLAIIGAQKPLLSAEVQSIDQYLSQGGRLLLLVDPQIQLGLDALLQKWGIQLSNYLAIDPGSARQSTGLNPRIAIVTNYGQHPITRSFGHGISLYPLARPLVLQATTGVQSTPILTTSADSWAASKITGSPLEFNPDQDLPGPLILGVAAQQASSRLVVIGSSQFVRDGVFEQQLNGDVFLNSVGWLSDRTTLATNPKEVTNRRISLSFWQAQLLFWLPIIVLPGASFIVASLLWWKRR
jgi:ABC-type uncharacterized transport system involved in gliding motility auxiliary subunit